MNTAELAKVPDLAKAANELEQWTEIIEPRKRLLDLRLDEVWRYRDLVQMFVIRNFTASYKQTILGPVWIFLQPLLTSLMYVIIFGRVAKLSTDGLPMIVFYLSGVAVWSFFAESLNKTATVFKDNASMFGKVYFPRIVMPLSIVISNIVRFGIQFFLFLIVWAYYLTKTGAIQPNWLIALTPLLLIGMGTLGLGLGMIISSMTTKYKDMIMLLSFGVSLLMYATPVIYPLSSISEEYRWLVVANPMSAILETFRYAFTGSGTFSWLHLAYSFGMSLLILAIGTIIFNRVEKSFTDTV